VGFNEIQFRGSRGSSRGILQAFAFVIIGDIGKVRREVCVESRKESKLWKKKISPMNWSTVSGRHEGLSGIHCLLNWVAKGCGR
jgi:hypothetical protein